MFLFLFLFSVFRVIWTVGGLDQERMNSYGDLAKIKSEGLGEDHVNPYKDLAQIKNVDQTLNVTYDCSLDPDNPRRVSIHFFFHYKLRFC